MTTMVEDLANEAFDAACGGEDGDINKTLNAIFESGPLGPLIAMQRWMSRTALVIEPSLDEQHVKLAVVADDADPDDDTQGSHPDDVIWAAELFQAFCNQDATRFRAMWRRLPPHQEFKYVHRVLTTMAVTTIAYIEEMVDDQKCCTTHRDPLIAASRLSMSHRN